MDFQVNLFAVIIAAVASMVLGFLWYGQLFKEPWMKLMGYTEKSMKEAQKEMGKTYFLSFAATLVSAFVLAHIMNLSENYYGYSSVLTGITSGFFVWLGFVAPVQMTEVFYGGKPWKLYGINTGYQLTSLLVMGVIIGLI